MGKVREDAAGLNIAYLLPCVTRAVRSPLECRGLDTIASILLGPVIRTVDGMGELPDILPVFRPGTYACVSLLI